MWARVFQRRMPAYMGGLLLSLGAMIAIMSAKKAFAPNFHEQTMDLAPQEIGAHGKVWLQYEEDPGHFLPPGFPSRAWLEAKSGGVVAQLSYRNLTDREVLLGELSDPGDYDFRAELYVCASPGVADCAKLKLSRSIRVKAGTASSEARTLLKLAPVAEAGLKAGPAPAP